MTDHQKVLIPYKYVLYMYSITTHPTCHFYREYRRLKAAEHQLHVKGPSTSQVGHGSALEEKIAEARRLAALDTPVADVGGGPDSDTGKSV